MKAPSLAGLLVFFAGVGAGVFLARLAEPPPAGPALVNSPAAGPAGAAPGPRFFAPETPAPPPLAPSAPAARDDNAPFLRRALAVLDPRAPDLSHSLLLALDLDPAETQRLETEWRRFCEATRSLEAAAVESCAVDEQGVRRIELVPYARQSAELAAELEHALLSGLDEGSRKAWREADLTARLAATGDYERRSLAIRPRAPDLWEVETQHQRAEGVERDRRFLDRESLTRQLGHLLPVDPPLGGP